MKRPFVGVTCGLSSERCNDLSPNMPFYHVYSIYCEAIWNAGGQPVILPPVNSTAEAETADDLLAHLDGIFFSGGGLSTAKSTGTLQPLMTQQPIRSAGERTLIQRCQAKKLPIIGSCRGHQMICETLGGTLGDGVLINHRQDFPYSEPTHWITVLENTKLSALIGDDAWNVNSIHRQYVQTCPSGFRVNAVGPEGTVEGMEAEDPDWFCMTFQYHPEMMPSDERAAIVLKAFIRAATAYAFGKEELQRCSIY